MGSEGTVAGVALSHAAYSFDAEYSYLVPEKFVPRLDVGMRVLVPFGKGNKRVIGFVTKLEKADVQNLKPLLAVIDSERLVTDEMMKIITSPHPEMWRKAYEAGITAVILPEFDVCMRTEQNTPYHIYSVGEHIIRSMQSIEPDPLLRLTMLLHDIAKPMVHFRDSSGRDHFKGHAAYGGEIAEEILRRLKFDNDTVRRVGKLIRYHDLRPKATDAAVRRAAAQIGPELFEDFIKIQTADAMAKNPEHNAANLARIETMEKIYRRIMARGDCLSLTGLAISGQDLLDAGMKPRIPSTYMIAPAFTTSVIVPSITVSSSLI